ncbi:DUF4271 domain-containing protein [Frigoriflavimonas asaccharolytica]|uniref:DUF4271 domain-containing protein n=1 Tax=Frigoriflavimonas asaccharolytica TaxID=2735899 RepID=A0A8J8G833_9FLAO|nr:DUF4271 domain-containing protein [Frigoriflavimonas asaccharolytica]NRS90985.1 hypothetical protein [Frigoriflavimonas asaccharolytica]
MLPALLFINDIRLTENKDWIVFVLLGCTVLYLFLMNTLQRDANLKSYLLQEYSETNNVFQSWMVVGIINTFLLSTLISQYIPVVPKFISNLQIFGLELNKFGFTLLSISIFYLFKSAISYLFFQSLGAGRKWKLFCFSATKFYFLVTLLLVVLNFAHYLFGLNYKGNFYKINSEESFPIYVLIGFIILLFKNIYYLFHKSNILGLPWYYKILYICTLQIAPVLALWKLLFI